MTDDVAVKVRGYLTVFGALLVLTALTVGVSYLQLPEGPAVAVGLTIALVKAGLVALFFMHLLHEQRTIYLTLLLTAVLFIALFALTWWTEADHILGTRFQTPFGPGEP